MKSLLPCLLLIGLTSCSSEKTGFVKMVDQEGRFDFVTANGKTLLSYQHAVYPAPEGIDPAFKRSGFIHPVNTLAGQLLTRIQPDDHYHHYGIWNPWTHTSFRGKEVDFWNLKKKQGTVRFAKLESTSHGPNFAAATVLHEHVAFNEDGSETVALLESQEIRVSATDHPDRYLIDITAHYTCGTEDPFTIVEYRYGGLCWRGPAAWNHANSSILTSQAHDRESADGSRARWVVGQGELDNRPAGIAILSHPNNYNSPTPLRTWAKANHHGETFINMAPTKTQDWQFQPGQTYTLRYRMIVFAGEISAEEIDAQWKHFAETAQN